jgi:hypothetical protein
MGETPADERRKSDFEIQIAFASGANPNLISNSDFRAARRRIPFRIPKKERRARR